MERYLIETSKVDARMVHHEHVFSFGEKAGLLDEYGFLRNPQWVQGLKTLDDVANECGAVIIAESGLGKSYIAREFAREKVGMQFCLLMCRSIAAILLRWSRRYMKRKRSNISALMDWMRHRNSQMPLAVDLGRCLHPLSD